MDIKIFLFFFYFLASEFFLKRSAVDLSRRSDTTVRRGFEEMNRCNLFKIEYIYCVVVVFYCVCPSRGGVSCCCSSRRVYIKSAPLNEWGIENKHPHEEEAARTDADFQWRLWSSHMKCVLHLFHLSTKQMESTHGQMDKWRGSLMDG